MIFQPSNCAHAVSTLSRRRSAITGWEGCDRGDPRRVTVRKSTCQWKPVVGCMLALTTSRLRRETGLSEGEKKNPEDSQMEFTDHISRLCVHFDMRNFELPRTAGTRSASRNVAAEGTEHFVDEA